MHDLECVAGGKKDEWFKNRETWCESMEDLTGYLFGRWVVMGFHSKTKNNLSKWVCECSCGVTKAVRADSLKNGDSQSCGCLQKEINSADKMMHGMSNTVEHKAWSAMFDRCLNKNSASYPGYGGRGIKICQAWYTFENFYADMGDRPAGMSLEREDNDGDYCPWNCVWADLDAQNNNRRTNRVLTIGGVSGTVAWWSRKTGLNNRTILSRLRNGWSVKDALTVEVT